MNYTIVDVELSHIPQIAALEQQCFSCPWTESQLKAQMHDSMHEFLAAINDKGSVLGYVGMMYVLDEGYISNVATASECRRCRVAESLVSALIERGIRNKLAFITLEVRAGNEPAKALYKKLGFIPVGIRKNYYSFPKEDAILMTKFLNRGSEFENTCI